MLRLPGASFLWCSGYGCRLGKEFGGAAVAATAVRLGDGFREYLRLLLEIRDGSCNGETRVAYSVLYY